MNLSYDPMPLVFARGDQVIRLTLLTYLGLEDSPHAMTCLLAVIGGQRSDGAFPSQLDAQRWGMRETVRTALLLLACGMPPEGINVAAAVRFILAHQHSDGGWSENPALALPPGETWLSNQHGITWLTVDVLDLLRQVGRGGSTAGQRALAWLRAVQTERGGWPSVARADGDGEEVRDDPDATVQITFLMGELYGEDDGVHQRGTALFERYLDRCARDAERGYRVRPGGGERVALDVYHLTHLLLSWPLDPPRRFQAGYDGGDRRVRRMMEALIGLQREDGGWRPFFAEESSPVYTALAVRALMLSGMLDESALREQLVGFAQAPAS